MADAAPVLFVSKGEPPPELRCVVSAAPVAEVAEVAVVPSEVGEEEEPPSPNAASDVVIALDVATVEAFMLTFAEVAVDVLLVVVSEEVDVELVVAAVLVVLVVSGVDVVVGACSVVVGACWLVVVGCSVVEVDVLLAEVAAEEGAFGHNEKGPLPLKNADTGLLPVTPALLQASWTAGTRFCNALMHPGLQPKEVKSEAEQPDICDL